MTARQVEGNKPTVARANEEGFFVSVKVRLKKIDALGESQKSAIWAQEGRSKFSQGAGFGSCRAPFESVGEQNGDLG